jgi:hypothetical protein
MRAGNSAAKLQLALGPNQIIQDNAVRNSADGLKEAVWLVWRTLIQYGDDYGVKKLAQLYHPDREPVFLDYQAWDDMNFCERKLMHIELAVGMQSEENQVARQQMIMQAQTELYTRVAQMTAAGTLTEAVYAKIKRPFTDTLYVLGVKDADTYLPTDDEVKQMIAQGEAAMKSREPSPDDQAKLAKAKLDNTKADEIAANVQGNTAERQLEYMNVAQGKTAAGIN